MKAFRPAKGLYAVPEERGLVSCQPLKPSLLHLGSTNRDLRLVRRLHLGSTNRDVRLVLHEDLVTIG